jgi:hypothetical protein
MRVPDERFISYSETQWRAIEAIGIDPATVVCGFSNLDGQPIRKWLEENGAAYASMVECTRRGARHRRKLQTALVAARAALDDPLFFLDGGYQARKALDAIIAKVAAHPKQGNKARQPHIRFWGELAKLYVHINRPHRASTKQLIAFLLACSQPVFPSATTPDAVATFAYRFWQMRT